MSSKLLKRHGTYRQFPVSVFRNAEEWVAHSTTWSQLKEEETMRYTQVRNGYVETVKRGRNSLGLDESLLDILDTTGSGGGLRGGSFGPGEKGGSTQRSAHRPVSGLSNFPMSLSLVSLIRFLLPRSSRGVSDPSVHAFDPFFFHLDRSLSSRESGERVLGSGKRIFGRL